MLCEAAFYIALKSLSILSILSNEGEYPNDDHVANAILVGLLQVSK